MVMINLNQSQTWILKTQTQILTSTWPTLGSQSATSPTRERVNATWKVSGTQTWRISASQTWTLSPRRIET